MKRDGARALVLDAVLDREHRLVVDRDRPAEDQSLAVVIGEGDRAARGNNRVVGAPHRVRPGQRTGLRPDPAELRIIGMGAAGGREQHDVRARRVDGLAVILQGDVVDAAALEADRSPDRGRVDGDARRARKGILARFDHGSGSHSPRQGRGGAAWLARRGGLGALGRTVGLLGCLLCLALLFGLRHGIEIVPARAALRPKGRWRRGGFCFLHAWGLSDSRRRWRWGICRVARPSAGPRP